MVRKPGMVTSEHSKGWIKLHRQSLDSQVWQNPHLWQLWCYCLLRANHEPGWFPIKTGKGETQVHLEPGQFIFGRFVAAKKLKAKPTTTADRLKKLSRCGNLVTQNRTHYTLVTVCIWEIYQNRDGKSVTQPSPNRLIQEWKD